MKVKDIKDIFAYANDDQEVKIYVKDEGKKVCFWYFNIKESVLKDDGLYIELE